MRSFLCLMADERLSNMDRFHHRNLGLYIIEFENNKFKMIYWETQGLDFLDIDWYLNYTKDNKSKFYRNNIEKLQFMINSAGYGKNLRMIVKK